MHRGNISKTHKENPERGRGPGHVTSIIFGVHPNVPPKGVELATWNLASRCTGAISQKPAKINPEKGRGLGHVTLIRRTSKTYKHIYKPLLNFLNSIVAKLTWKLLIKQQILNSSLQRCQLRKVSRLSYFRYSFWVHYNITTYLLTYTVSQKTTLMLHTIDSTHINRFR